MRSINRDGDEIGPQKKPAEELSPTGLNNQKHVKAVFEKLLGLWFTTTTETSQTAIFDFFWWPTSGNAQSGHTAYRKGADILATATPQCYEQAPKAAKSRCPRKKKADG